MKRLGLLVLSVFVFQLSQAAEAKSLNSRLDRIGGSKELRRKTRALNPNNRFRVVQKREVDRTMRLELGINYGFHNSGDPYVETQAIGGFADLHITPRWSFGARYYDFSNELTPEGERVFDAQENRALFGDTFSVPSIDFPLSTTLGVVSFYPLYGKLNFFDSSVAQFDIYLLGGAGQIELNSGPTETWTAGGGVGVWMTNHFASRLEVRYQAYQDQVLVPGGTDSRNQDMVVTTFSVGFML